MENGGFFRFKVGGFEILSVTDGHALFQPVQPVFAPMASPDAVSQVLADNFLPTDMVDVAFNVLVLKMGRQTVLFDSGCGHHFGPLSGKLPANLLSAGIKRQDVTDIILTHAHPDHIGGLTDQEGGVLFPNARVWIARQEYDFWTAADPNFSRSKADAAFTQMMVNLARANLKAVQHSLHFFDHGDVILDAIRLEVIPGHTP